MKNKSIGIFLGNRVFHVAIHFDFNRMIAMRTY